MIATMLAMLSKFLVFMGKLMTVMMKTWHHTFTTMKLTWNQISNQLYNLIHHGMHNIFASLQ
jgi:flagellar biosynthesis protein FliR